MFPFKINKSLFIILLPKMISYLNYEVKSLLLVNKPFINI